VTSEKPTAEGIPEEETPSEPQTRYADAQAKKEARYAKIYGGGARQYKGRWRGKPRKKRKKKGPVDLGRLVYEQLRRHVPADALRLERLQQQWPHLVTPRIANRTWPAKLYGRRLLVIVHDNQWLHELGYLRQELVQRIAAQMPEANVNDMILRLGRVPEAKRRMTSPQPPDQARKAPLSGDVPETTQEAIAAVQDPELREAIEAARHAFGGKTR
jgi:predicted nucleic acid-binding Zn ribbon protein